MARVTFFIPTKIIEITRIMFPKIVLISDANKLGNMLKRIHKVTSIERRPTKTKNACLYMKLDAIYKFAI